MKELEQIERINTCIELAQGRIQNRKMKEFIFNLDRTDPIEILNKSILRLEERRKKIVIGLYKLYVTKTK